ncbi:cathepsin G [Thomomys bottae]
MQLLLILLAFCLPLRAKTEEIIGGHEAKPHSRPYMAYLRISNGVDLKKCGGFLIREDFVMTAAHCYGSSINVTLGAHNIKKLEKTQQVIPVRKAFPHPDYNRRDHSNDIMLLQLQRKAKKTTAVNLIRLPKNKSQAKPGQVCYVAGWGQMTLEEDYPNTLQEVKLTVQEDQECNSRFEGYYKHVVEICVGDPKMKRRMQPLLLFLALILPPWAEAGKIIGGREARPHSHPYMAFLHIQNPEGRSLCGGFLVRDDFVMTAAHCWGSSINVTLGGHNIQRQERTQQHITVRRAIRHPDYSQQTIQNDIMLLQLEKRVRRNRAVRPVSLPQAKKNLRPGTLCTVAGWGRVGPSQRTDVLQEVTLRVQRNRECSSRFQNYTCRTQICVGNPRERKSAFKGDSGGPLVCNNVAQGIVSYGKQSGTPPEVFTKISSFLTWIKRVMRRYKPQDSTPSPHPDNVDSVSHGYSLLHITSLELELQQDLLVYKYIFLGVIPVDEPFDCSQNFRHHDLLVPASRCHRCEASSLPVLPGSMGC